MAPVIAAALISAAATMAKSQADKRANAGNGAGGNYQVDVKAPDSGNGNQPQMQIEEYKAPQKSGGNNSNGAMIDAASDVVGKMVTSKMESYVSSFKNIY